jgi:hypothetical protein
MGRGRSGRPGALPSAGTCGLFRFFLSGADARDPGISPPGRAKGINARRILKMSGEQDMSCLSYAHLEKDAIHRIEECEKEMDAIILVYEKPVHPAALSSDGLGRLQKLEAEMGVRLVAYE